MVVPAARLGLVGVISIDSSLGVAALLSSRQPLRTSSPNSSAALVNFVATNKPRDERVKMLPNMSDFRCGLRLVSSQRRGSQKTTTNRFVKISTSSRFLTGCAAQLY